MQIKYFQWNVTSEERCPISVKYTLGIEDKGEECKIPQFLYWIHDEVIFGDINFTHFFTFCCTLKKVKLETADDKIRVYLGEENNKQFQSETSG